MNRLKARFTGAAASASYAKIWEIDLIARAMQSAVNNNSAFQLAGFWPNLFA